MEGIGILDPGGLKPNPLTGGKYSKKYRELAEKVWTKLGLFNSYPTNISKREEREAKSPAEFMISQIKKYQVLIIQSGTGSGKTVMLPKYALHAVDYKGTVVSTNPKQAPTRSNAAFAALALDVKLGEEVGFQHQDSKLDDGSPSKSESTKLLFSTDGSVAEVLKNDPTGSSYDVVIIDEAHERNLNIDKLLFLCKKALTLNPNFKLIVTSATLDVQLFVNYFQEFNMRYLDVAGKPNKHVEIHYLTSKENKSLGRSIQEKGSGLILKEILNKKKPGNILAFVASDGQGKQMMEMIADGYRGEENILYAVVSRGSLNKFPQLESIVQKEKVEDEEGGPFDRIILFGTNVTESSMTFPGLKYVVDGGKAFQDVYDPDTMFQELKQDWISKAAAAQRAGRTGRTNEGDCYRLYTEEKYNSLRSQTLMDIEKNNLTSMIFDIFLGEGVETVGDIRAQLHEYIQPPGENYVRSAIKTLRGLQLITSSGVDGELTRKGIKVLDCNGILRDPMRTTILVTSIDYKCNFQVSAILAIFQMLDNKMGNIITTFFGQEYLEKKGPEREDFEKKRNSYYQEEGLIWTCLHIYSTFFELTGDNPSERALRDFCRENYLNYENLAWIRDEHYRIYLESKYLEKYRDGDIKILSEYNSISLSLLSGLFINIGRIYDSENETYVNWFPKKQQEGVTDVGIDYQFGTKYIYSYKLQPVWMGMGFSPGFTVPNKVDGTLLKLMNRELGYDINFSKLDVIR